ESALEAVAEHLERCTRCETRAQRLDTAVDLLLEGLRTSHFADRGESLGLSNHSGLHPRSPKREDQVRGNPYTFLLPPAAPDEIGRLGAYRVLRLLGQGGMAFVFHAEDLALRRPVALKVMRPELNRDSTGWRRFLREAQIMAAIDSKHLVKVYQVGQQGET